MNPYTDASDILRNSGLFHDIGKELLEKFLAPLAHESWTRQRYVPAEQIRERFHIIVSGRVRIEQINEDTGRTLTLFLLAPGDVFDMCQLLTDQPCEGVFYAQDDLDLLTLPTGEMREWISAHPECNRCFLPYLGRQMRGLAELAGDIALHDTETRLAHLIMHHLDETDPSNHHIRLINDLPHEVLAEMIGSVRAVVNRQLQHWRKQGIVSLDHGRIHIEKLESLLKRSHRYQLPPPEETCNPRSW